MFCQKTETLIICHPIFSKREIGLTKIDLKIVYNNCGLGFLITWG